MRFYRNRIVAIHAYLDTQKVEAVYQHLAEQGVSSARCTD